MSSYGYKVLYGGQYTQRTYRSIVAQVINLYGVPIRYLPKIISNQTPNYSSEGFGATSDVRSNVGLNHIYGEDVNISYEETVPMKCILDNVDFYQGQHNLFDKFGSAMEDEIIIQIETESWRNLMRRMGFEKEKPEEGDLITFDLAKAKNNRPQLFEIRYCNESDSYFAFGQLMVFKLTCKLWDYSHERLSTGDPTIDSLAVNASDVNATGDNSEIEEKAEEVVRWHPNDKFKDEF